MAFFPISCNSQKHKKYMIRLEIWPYPCKLAISMEIPRDNGKGFQEETHCIQRAAKTCAHQLWIEFSEPYNLNLWLCCVQDKRSWGEIQFLSHDSKAIYSFLIAENESALSGEGSPWGPTPVPLESKSCPVPAHHRCLGCPTGKGFPSNVLSWLIYRKKKH